MKQNLIRTIDLIGKALHPDHLKSTEFVFSKRGDLINHLLVSSITIVCTCDTHTYTHTRVTHMCDTHTHTCTHIHTPNMCDAHTHTHTFVGLY